MTAAASQANRPVLGERYELVSRIGAGASAQVFHAIDRRLNRHVAIKHLRPDFASDPRFLKLFRAEAHLAAQLSHPNVVAVYDWSDEAASGPFIVTELLAGGTLRDMILGDRALTISQVAFIGLQAAQGLAFAHEQGLVHRDVKPANLLFGHEGRVRVADFGIARAVAESAWTEPEGVLIGTARYAAPEQATEGLVDGLADVYSLALCLVEAVSGQLPLLGENALATMTIRQTVDIPVQEELADTLGPLADALVDAGKADRAERVTAAELLEQLLVVHNDLPTPAPLPLLDVTTIGEPVPPGAQSVGDQPANGQRGPGSGPIILGERPAGRDDAHSGPESVTFDGIEVDTEAPTELPGPLDRQPVDNGIAVQPGGAVQVSEPPPQYETYRRPRRRWPLLVGLLFLLAATAGAAIFGPTLLEQARPETTVIDLGLPTFEVADFQSSPVAEIRSQAGQNGWSVELVEDYEDGTSAGEILRQSPEPGASLAPGETIMIVISLGPELRIVPDVVGVSVEQARAVATEASLNVGQIVERNDEAISVGVVLEATIGGIPAQPGAEVVTGTEIDLVVSGGPTPRQVPNLVGLSVDQARSALADLSLAIETSELFSETVPEGEIISSNPAADEMLARGSTVSVVVSLGLPFVEIPELTGMPAADAATQLEELGLVIEDTDGPPNRPVLITDPVAGTSVRLGTSIRIIVSR